MKLVLPFRGEFGHVCMWHAPQVHAIGSPKVVVCERRLRPMYPSATHFVDADPIEDKDRRGKGHVNDASECARWVKAASLFGDLTDVIRPDQNAPQRQFVPSPAKHQIATTPDVVVCPRKRQHDSCRNWPRWMALVERLKDEGHTVFAAGVKDSSDDGVKCEKAWEHDDPLSATIEAMRSARVVIATDSGLAHLAVMCGAPLCMIVHGDDLISPGTTDDGTPMWPVLMGRYQKANHLNVPIRLASNGWVAMDRVVETMRQVIDDRRKQLRSPGVIRPTEPSKPAEKRAAVKLLLASYPRSGNTMLRANLYRAFGIKSASVYKDDLNGDADLAEKIGHVGHNRIDEAGAIKTHGLPGVGGAPGVYIVRDGRDALHSYWEFMRRATDIASVIQGATAFGSWSTHVLAWSRTDNIEVVRYEDVIADVPGHMAAIGQRFGLGPMRPDFTPAAREEMTDGKFVRDESKPTWRDVWSDAEHDMFWDLHGEVMRRLRYERV